MVDGTGMRVPAIGASGTAGTYVIVEQADDHEDVLGVQLRADV
jgi:hypothetical protein